VNKMDDRGYQTIPALMLKHTEYGELLHGKNTIYTMQEALQMCDALEEVVTVWKEGLDAFGMTSQEECSNEAFGAIMIMRMGFHDLKHALPQVPREEADNIIKELGKRFLPLARSYTQTPMLAHWYAGLPSRVAETYNRLRGQR
tara:strand:- start:186 stop:617 length:432 start_codon:yes stop_codon:yes gene_type:complete